MDLLTAIQEAEKLLPKRKLLVGIACSPAVEQALKKECSYSGVNSIKTPHLGWGNFFYGAPIIVDSRLGDKAEVYHCPKLWLERVKEQNEYDNRINYQRRITQSWCKN
jgi:hypothetical protein